MAAARCLLGRLSATPFRRYQLQGPRFITSSAALWANSSRDASSLSAAIEQEEKPPVDFGLSRLLRDKTGVTGAWTLGVGVTCYLISKELYIVNSETVIAVVMGGMIYWLVKKIGKPISDFLDSKSQIVLDLFTNERNARKSGFEEALAMESKVESELELRHDVFEVAKENNVMRLEEEYRRRLHEVTNTVKRQLDYQVEVEKVERKFQQEHMVQWLERSVKEMVQGKQDESLAQCMRDLQKMAA